MRLLAVLILLAAEMSGAQAFNGNSAFEFTRRAVAFGPRPSGSEAIRKLRAYIYSQLKPLGCQIVADDFRASTPNGSVAMQNIIARFPGTSGRAVVVTGHYDTKILGGRFVGANDGGSSTGFLLEMARVVARMPHKNDIWLVWFDGEEAVDRWSDTDGTYGSRHLAERWRSDGTIRRVKALINVDMIGDRSLGIIAEEYSSATLRRLVWTTARELGFGSNFLSDRGAILDDHIPFLQAGVMALDLIDFQYGPDNEYWHSDQDTMDKLSAASLNAVGRVVEETLRRLE